MVPEQPQQRRKSREITALSCTRRQSSPPVGTGCDPRLPWVPRAVLALPEQSPRWASAAVPATRGSHRVSLPPPSVSCNRSVAWSPVTLAGGWWDPSRLPTRVRAARVGSQRARHQFALSCTDLAQPRAAAARSSQCLVRSFSLFFFPIVF